jgi:hypothetical protein
VKIVVASMPSNTARFHKRQNVKEVKPANNFQVMKQEFERECRLDLGKVEE